MNKRTVLALIATALSLHCASATLLIQENFNGYTAGNINGQAVTGTGLTGSWAVSGATYTVQASSLSFAGHFASSGGSLGITVNGGGDKPVAAAVSSSVLSTLSGVSTFYISSLQTVNTGTYDNNLQIEQRFSSTAGGSASAGRNEVSSYSSGTTSARKLAVSSSTTETKQGTPTMNAGTVYLLVTKYTVSGGSITAATIYAFDAASYANYLANSTTAAAADANLATYAYATLSASGTVSLTGGAFTYLQFSCYKSVGSGQIDDFRLGTSILDVVNITAPPTITGLTNQTLQVGQSTTLSATVDGSPTPTLQWYLSTDGGATSNAISGATSASYALSNVQYSQNGYIYYLWANNSSGTTVSNMTLTVTHTAPSITGLTNQMVYAGNNVTMTGTVSGVPTPTLQWYNGASALTAKTNSSLTLTAVSVADSGTYSLVASNEAGIVTNSMTLTVVSASVPPTIAGLTNQTVLDGGSATLAATVDGNPAPALQWYLSTDGGVSSNILSGATSSTYALNSVTYSQNGYIYYLMASNTAGVVVSNMTLTVQQVAPTITGLTNQTLILGMNATLTTSVSGAPAPALQWLVNGAPITSATNSTLVLTNVQLSQSGYVYSLVATNPAGILTNSMTLTVTPVPSMFVKLSDALTTPAPTSINPPAGQSYSGAAPVAGTIWNVIARSSLAPSGLVAPTNYVVYSALPLLDPSSNSIIPGLTVSFNVYSGSTTRTAPSTASGNVALQPGGVMSDVWRDYEWGSGYFVFTVSNLPPSAPLGLYFYGGTATANQGAGIQLNFACALGGNPTFGRNTNNVLATLSDGITTTYGSLWTFSGGATNLMPQGSAWNVLYGASDANGNFTFTNYANTVSGIEGAWLNGFQLVPLSAPTQAGLTNQTVVAGNNATLGSSVAGMPVPALQWFSNNVAIPGATTSSLTLNNVQYAQNGTVYSLVASNVLGSITNSMTLAVIVTPAISGLADTAASPGTTVTLPATVSGVPTPSLQWLLAGAPLSDGATGNGSTISGSTTATLTIANAAMADSGYYSLVASNAAGMVTNTFYLTVATTQAPVITGPTDQTVIQGSNATFSVTVSANPVAALQWLDQTGAPIPGANGNTLILTNVQYSQDGYVYSLVASNSVGSATNSAALHVLVPVSISGQPQNVVVTNTQSASFTVTASGVPNPSYYQWYLNGSAISGANSATYTIGSTTPANIGSYQVVVSNSVNTVTSAVATLTVNSTMGYSSLMPSNGATAVCYDTPLYITFSSSATLRTAGKIRIYNITNSTLPVDTIDLSLSVTNHPTLAANVQAYTVGGMTVTNFPVIITGNIAAIYPHQGLLTSNQTYYITVDNGAFTDNSGAYFAGITATNLWKFTTKVGGPLNATNLVVAQDYSGDFATLQGAVNAVPSGNTTPTIINIRNGVYTEFVNVNGRNNLDFRGQSRNGTLIGYANNNNLNPGAPQRSAFIINGNDCTLETLTLTNMTPVGGGQAEAVDVEGTRAIFYNMELDSHQDTFLVHYSGKLVHFQDSLVAGDTDFLWGYGTVYYTNCELRSYGANVTQPRNPVGQRGFGFMNCRVTAANAGVTSIGLGRTFGQTNAQALFAYCLMDDAVTGFADAGSTNTADYACSNLTATVSKSLVNSVHLTGSEPDAIAVQSASTWLYGWQPQAAPNIITQPVGQTVSHGQAANFAVGATGIPAPVYQWFKNGSPIVGATNATFAVASPVRTDAGTYSVIASNSAGTVTSSSVTLTYNNTAPVAQTMTVNRTAGLSLKVAWSDLATNWSDADLDVVTLNNLTLTTTNGVTLQTNSSWIVYTNGPSAADQISYSVSDGFGGITSGYINIVMNPFVTGQDTSVSVSNNSAALTFYGIPNYSYIVQRATNIIGSNWTDIATSTVPQSGVITVTDGFGDLGTVPQSAYYRLKWQP